MPDLGAYAGPVLMAYGVSAVLIGGIVALTWVRALRMARALKAMEARDG